MRFYYRYVLGLAPVEETESLRYGTYWHKILEVQNLVQGEKCCDCGEEPNQNCPICEGSGVVSTTLGMDLVVKYLNWAYQTIPVSKTPEEAAVEQTILLYSLIGYNWYYENRKNYEILAQEIKFDLPLKSPITGRTMPNTAIHGKIDKVLKNPATGQLFIGEHKSTSDSLEADSTYWGHLNLDTQTLLYPYAARRLDVGFDTSRIGILYDVWHKPGIRPKMLTQGDSKAFMESGEYCGQKFEIGKFVNNANTDPVLKDGYTINGTYATMEPGKKEGTFAIKETPDMFGARLLQDITQRPEFYFCTKEIARTDDDLVRFESELFNMYQTIRTMKKNKAWWCNETQCEATFKCPYINFCYSNKIVGENEIPEGFKCIFKKEKE
jgi:hypothetical protein